MHGESKKVENDVFHKYEYAFRNPACPKSACKFRTAGDAVIPLE